MDDSPASPNNRMPLGMNAFGNSERQQLGQNLRLAMACIEGSAEPVRTKAMPSDEADIRQRLKALSQDITSHHADLLELLVRFDELQGWKSGGASHCAAWMNLEIGISLQLGWEYLRVGRKLRSLPITTALFRAGKLSWSKIRLIVNVASADNEKTLCHAALDASVSDVKSLCNGYRWNDDGKNSDKESDSENERSLKQWDSRALLWDEVGHGSTRIQLILPPEVAQAFLNSVEHSLNQLEESNSENRMSQRRADAAVLMAETSLQAAGRDIATADRYQVIVSVNASDLANNPTDAHSSTSTNIHGSTSTNLHGSTSNDDSRVSPATIAPVEPASANQCNTPQKRPVVIGAGPIAIDTARRIACDCSITSNVINNGEPIDVGRKTRIWSNAMTRAIKDRDQHCQWPGCSHTRNLQIHHIHHWADGGSTSVENGACLCQFHHSMVHEGGYSIQRIDDNAQYADELFALQQHASDLSMFDFEKELRNDREAFNRIRQLMPTRFRFRVVDAGGRDIREHLTGDEDFSHLSNSQNNKSRVDHEPHEPHERRENQNNQNRQGHLSEITDDFQYRISPKHSTRVECNEPVLNAYHCAAQANFSNPGQASAAC